MSRPGGVPYSVIPPRDENEPDGELRGYGPLHGSMKGDVTLCGLQTDEDWYISTNDRRGLITCRECLAKIVASQEPPCPSPT